MEKYLKTDHSLRLTSEHASYDGCNDIGATQACVHS